MVPRHSNFTEPGCVSYRLVSVNANLKVGLLSDSPVS